MKVRLWGVRGSVPVADTRMSRYGGNTSCVEVVLSDGTELILDAGTGIRELGAARSPSPGAVRILITHLHLDHIQGLLFFSPLFDPDCDVEVFGPPSPGPGLERRLGRYLSEPLSPVEIRELPARVDFAACPYDAWEVGPATIQAATVVHRGVTLGYRITEGDVTLAYVPDHEPRLLGPVNGTPPEWLSGYELAHDADLLIHDSQYLDEEYEGHAGWGHSAVSDALAFAHAARARNLLLFHHDPLHDDDTLDRLEAGAREWIDGNGTPLESVQAAREHTTIDL